MSTLAKLRVTERHGIRRFLYPLSTTLALTDANELEHAALMAPNGSPVPAYIHNDPESDRLTRVDFAVSLAPFESIVLDLVDGEPMRVPDPMSHTRSAGGGIECVQERFSTIVDDNAVLARVVYDGDDYLRGPLSIDLNGQHYSENNNRLLYSHASEIGGSVCTGGIYASNAPAATTARTTACKSWVTQQHRPRSRPGDRVGFNLPFFVESPSLLCDFGLGGGVYTKFSRDTTEEITVIVEPDLSWTLRNGERIDYAGTLAKAPDSNRPRYPGFDALWFHVVDRRRSIAVAITEAPVDTAGIRIRIRNTGDIVVEFESGTHEPEGALYSVCYHFLNDVPAIAAATCPQSILLPPTVEVIDSHAAQQANAGSGAMR